MVVIQLECIYCLFTFTAAVPAKYKSESSILGDLILVDDEVDVIFWVVGGVRGVQQQRLTIL